MIDCEIEEIPISDEFKLYGKGNPTLKLLMWESLIQMKYYNTCRCKLYAENVCSDIMPPTKRAGLFEKGKYV